MATIKDVAALCGVSYSTVSLVLNNKGDISGISKATQEKVLLAALELKYTPNTAARSLKSSQKGFTIALYWADDYRWSFISRIMAGIQNALSSFDDEIKVVIRTYKNDFLKDDASLITGTDFHGAIIAAASFEDLKYLENSQLSIPIILLNRSSEKYPTVEIDNTLIGKQSAQYFFNNNIKSVTAFFTFENHPTIKQRDESFLSACSSKDINVNAVYLNDNTMKSGYNYILNNFKLKNSLTDGIFCDSDFVARGILSALNDKNWKCPEDVSILSMRIGELDACKYSNPPLTTINIPYENLAQNCVQLLMGFIKKEHTFPIHITLESDFYIGKSFKD